MFLQKDKGKRQIFVPIVLLTTMCFYCLTTPAEYVWDLHIFGWTKFAIAIPFISILAFITRWTKGNLLRISFLFLTIIVIIYSRDISDRAFLGKQLAYKYLGEDAGFIELYLFDSGKCKITNGGIFAVRETHYGSFRKTIKSVVVSTEADIADLTRLTINLQDKELNIEKL